MSHNILITGATGNVGEAIIHALFEQQTSNTIIAGVRDVCKSARLFNNLPKLQYRHFDFEDPTTYDTALTGIDTLFLLRPPHISDVKRIFAPLLSYATLAGIKQIVFLSVQGAETMSFIPHAKIETMIVKSKISYCMLRPSYFMQNLTTTLKTDIDAGCIVLPAGKALFNWIDVADIGRAASVILNNFERFTNQAIELTGAENLSFEQVIETINVNCNKKLKYRSPNLLTFYRYKHKQRVPAAMILVMIMLHILPRLQHPPHINANYKLLTGEEPTSLKEFCIVNFH